MNRTEIKALLQILSTAFPTHYKKLSVEEMKAQVSLYEMMFADDDGQIVTVALKNYIAKEKYPPTIAGLRAEIDLITKGDDKVNELWGELGKAVRQGMYYTQEEFDSLPKALRVWLKDRNQLKELCMLSPETFQTVTRGQFFKTMSAVVEREQAIAMLPAEVKDKLKGLMMLEG
jgi:hypothetical protein|nr:MAG TPA: replisome organizer [Caudoviricetes sp.]